MQEDDLGFKLSFIVTDDNYLFIDACLNTMLRDVFSGKVLPNYSTVCCDARSCRENFSMLVAFIKYRISEDFPIQDLYQYANNPGFSRKILNSAFDYFIRNWESAYLREQDMTPELGVDPMKIWFYVDKINELSSRLLAFVAHGDEYADDYLQNKAYKLEDELYI